MILDPDACISDAGFFQDGRTNRQTDKQGDSVMHVSRMPISLIHLHMMHIPMMYVCMMHVRFMHISMTLDLDACVYDAYIFDP